MTRLGVRDAFGGRWSWNLTGWAMMLFPGTLVVAVHETSLLHLPAPSLLVLILISSVAQSLAAGLVTATIATLARRPWRILPLALVIAMWAAIGIVRGITGGLIAEVIAGENPQFGQRAIAWIIVSLVWMPLFVYTAAQIEHRRGLLTALSSLRVQFAQEDARSRLSFAELGDSLLVTVKDRIRPVIDEIRRSLEGVASRSDVGALEVISGRLTAVASDTESLLAQSTAQPAEALPPINSRPVRASVTTALALELRHPGRTSLLSGIAIVPTVIPIALTLNVFDTVLDTGIGLAAVVIILWVTGTLRRRIIPAPRLFAGATAAIMSYLVAGLSGSVTMLLLDAGGLGAVELVTVVLLPAATVISASCVTLAVGIGAANDELVTTLRYEQRRILEARRRSAARDEEVRDQLKLLMHGPVQGRLSACVMALNFHFGSPHPDDVARTRIVTSAVIDHLAAASRDLEALPAISFGARQPF